MQKLSACHPQSGLGLLFSTSWNCCLEIAMWTSLRFWPSYCGNFLKNQNFLFFTRNLLSMPENPSWLNIHITLLLKVVAFKLWWLDPQIKPKQTKPFYIHDVRILFKNSLPQLFELINLESVSNEIWWIKNHVLVCGCPWICPNIVWALGLRTFVWVVYLQAYFIH